MQNPQAGSLRHICQPSSAGIGDTGRDWRHRIFYQREFRRPNLAREPDRPSEMHALHYARRVKCKCLLIENFVRSVYPPVKVLCPPMRVVSPCVSCPHACRVPMRVPQITMVREHASNSCSSVWFKFGGDYRSGRRSRWRIHAVRSENGEYSFRKSPMMSGMDKRLSLREMGA